MRQRLGSGRASRWAATRPQPRAGFGRLAGAKRETRSLAQRPGRLLAVNLLRQP